MKPKKLVADLAEGIEAPATRFLRGLAPDEANLDISSLRTFLKLVTAFGLIVRVQPTLVHAEALRYASKSRDHNIGDIRKPAYEYECVFVTATNLFDFAVTAAWYEGKFVNAFVGGKRSGHRPPAYFTQITKTNEEIKRCLAS